MTAVKVPTQYGELSGFQKPMTEDGKVLDLVDSVLALEDGSNNQKLLDRRVFRLITRFILFNKEKDVLIPLPPRQTEWYYLRFPNKKQNPLLDRVNQWILEFFRKQHPGRLILSDKEVVAIRRLAKDFCYLKLGFAAEKLSEQFSKEDLSVLGISERTLKLFQINGQLIPHRLNCHEFTLIKIKEIGVTEYLFSGKQEDDLSKFLPRWGYEVVSTGQLNDLVLFFEKGKLQHTARYIGNGFIESKLGWGSVHCHRHPIHLEGSLYGTHIVFFRKMREGSYLQLTQILKNMP